MSSRSGFKLGRRGEMSGRTFGPHPPNQHIGLGYFFFIYNMLGWVTGRKLWADFTWCIGRLGCFFIKSKSRQLSSKHFVKVLLSSSLFFPNITNYIMATEQNWSRSMVSVPLICILEYSVQDLTNSHHLGFVSWTRTQPNPRWKSCSEAQRRQGI